MRILIYTLLLKLVLVAVSAQDNIISKTQTHFLLIGGSGENSLAANEKAYTTFDYEYENIRKYIDKAKNVSPEFKFDGQFKTIKEIDNRIDFFTQKAFSPISQGPGTVDQIENSIAKLKNDIEHGRIKEGQQIVIYISSHGTENDGSEKTHSIAIAPGVSINNQISSEALESGSDARWTIDNLIPLIESAKKAKVLLGVIDTSCYSGASLALANDTTCIISGSSATLPTRVGFAYELSRNLASGKTLEEVFLKTRTDISASGGGNPQISTPAGIETLTILENLQKYFLEENVEVDFLKKNDMPENAISCSLENNKTTLSVLLQNLKAVLPLFTPEMAHLEKAMKDYQEQFRLTQNLFETQRTQGEQEISSGPVKFKWKELQKVNLEKIIKDYSTGALSFLPFSKISQEERLEKLKDHLEHLKNISDLKVKTLQGPEFTAYVSNKKLYEDSLKTLEDASYKVLSHERKIYQQLYKKNESTLRNPCKEIIL